MRTGVVVRKGSRSTTIAADGMMAVADKVRGTEAAEEVVMAGEAAGVSAEVEEGEAEVEATSPRIEVWTTWVVVATKTVVVVD